MEVNSLVLNVKSDTVATASKRLDQLEDSSKGAERATDKFTRSARTATGSTKTYRDAAGRLRDEKGKYVKAENSATAATKRYTKGATRATRATRSLNLATGGLNKGLGILGAKLAAVFGPILAIKKLLGSTVEIQDFRAQLKTATGSVENATIAFDALEDFASQTPYALEQSLEAFIKLTNLGLTPSERALESYGNTASAMGKDLTQLIEAVADAATGEFERLKEFGIKAKNQGDTIAFTFRGVTEEVKNNATEIEEYLIRIGENEFAGAMSERMATVGGQLSNLGDLWEQLFRTISEMGVGSLIGSTIQIAIDALSELIAQLESGQFEKSVESWTVAFEGWANDFDETIGFITDLFGASTDEMADDGESVWTTFIDAIKLVPAMVRYWIQRIAIEILVIGQYGWIAGKAIFTGLKEYLAASVDAAVEAAKAIGEALMNPIDTFNNGIDFGGVSDAMINGGERIAGVIGDAQKEAAATRQARIDTLGEIKAEYEATADKIVATRRESEKLRAAYDAEKKARQEANDLGDRLAQFKIQPKATGGGGGGSGATRPRGGRGGGGGGGRSAPSGPSEFDLLVNELRAEEKAIEESYLKRLELIRNNTEAGSALRAELEGKVAEQYKEDVEKFAEKTLQEYDIVKSGFSLQLEELDAYYQRRRELILENEALTEEEKTALVVAMTQERNELVRNLEITRAKQGLQMADDYFGNFAQLAKSGNKKLARIGEAALKAQKAIAITQATIKTYESATSAYAAMAGIPYVGPALGTAAAALAVTAGLANIAAIATAPTSVGNFATGGIVPGSSFTGDNLTANVNSSEMILNRQQQSRLFDMANGRGPQAGGAGNVIIINQTSTPVEAETRVNAGGEREIIIREAVDRTKQQLANEADTGGGIVVPALQRNFGLRRKGA